MKSALNTQVGAAIALTQLLTEHPQLSKHVTWSIPRTLPKLTGYIHDENLTVLAVCQEILGGSVHEGDAYERDEEWAKQRKLLSTWRDVPVEILVSVPVPAPVLAVPA